MKKYTRRLTAIILVMMFSLIFFALPVSADTGPKPTLDITLKNPPDEEYYIDLLYYAKEELSDEDKAIYINYYVHNGYNQEMVELLFNYSEEGKVYRLADDSIISGSDYNTFGSNDTPNTYSFGYIETDNFKIIIVTKSGKVFVSDEIHKEAFYSKIIYDVKNNQWSESNAEDIMYNIKWFLITLIMTVVIEGILLIFFCVGEIDSKIQAVKNILLFFAVNIVTQIFLYLCLYFIGNESYLWAEVVILVIEALAYFLFFTPKHRMKFIIYAVLANICSFVGGIHFIIIYGDLLLRLF